jgi:hypothetical protein
MSEYRIEVFIRRLSLEQQGQFLAAAKEAGFQVRNDGVTFTIAGLTSQQATTLRDGLLDLGILASISR